MKINAGKYIVKTKADVELAFKHKNDIIEEQSAQLVNIQRVARAMLAMHMPYTNDIDLSSHKDLKRALLEKLVEREPIWCSQCRSPWPCKTIEPLRMIKNLAHGYGNNGDDLQPLEDLLETLVPPDAPAPFRVRF